MSNGGYIGPYQTKDLYTAKGVWRVNDINRSKQRAQTWPLATNDTLTYRTTTTGTTTALTHPVGVAAGDLCVVIHTVYSTASDILFTSPTGFDIIGMRYLNISGSNYLSSIMYYSVLADTTNITLTSPFDIATNGPGTVTSQRFRALYFYLDRTITTLRHPILASSADTADPPSITADLTPYSQAVPLLFVASAVFQTNTTALSFTTESPTLDATITNASTSNVLMHTGYKIYNSTADVASHTIDIGDQGGGQILQTGLIVVNGT